MNIILFVIVLSVLVFVHELGHFLFAKMAKIKVISFAIGFQPTLFKKKIGETTYRLNAIPFGGYVRIHGQNIEEELKGKDLDKTYFSKPALSKIGFLTGGVLFNIIFAWLLLSFSLMLGTPTILTESNKNEIIDVSTRILSVGSGSSAEKAGIRVGSEVAGITLSGALHEDITTEKLASLVEQNPNESFVFEIINNDGQTQEIKVRPSLIPGNNKPLLGLSVEPVGNQKLPIYKALWIGLKNTHELSKDTLNSFIGLIKQAVKGQADVSTLTGPVGLVGLVGDAASYGLTYLLFFTALISINLAVLNLIPFPALDGGQVLFVLIEKIIGRPIPLKVSNVINIAGFALLIILMVSVTVFDFVKIL